jgi:hypothetical protein
MAMAILNVYGWRWQSQMLAVGKDGKVTVGQPCAAIKSSNKVRLSTVQIGSEKL